MASDSDLVTNVVDSVADEISFVDVSVICNVVGSFCAVDCVSVVCVSFVVVGCSVVRVIFLDASVVDCPADVSGTFAVVVCEASLVVGCAPYVVPFCKDV